MFNKITTILLQIILATSCTGKSHGNLISREKGKFGWGENEIYVTCKNCEDGTEICKRCKGDHNVKTRIILEDTKFLPFVCDLRGSGRIRRECYICDGTGRVRCTKCHGLRRVKRK